MAREYKKHRLTNKASYEGLGTIPKIGEYVFFASTSSTIGLGQVIDVIGDRSAIVTINILAQQEFAAAELMTEKGTLVGARYTRHLDTLWPITPFRTGTRMPRNLLSDRPAYLQGEIVDHRLRTSPDKEQNVLEVCLRLTAVQNPNGDEIESSRVWRLFEECVEVLEGAEPLITVIKKRVFDL